jgi:hypothetical protein
MLRGSHAVLLCDYMTGESVQQFYQEKQSWSGDVNNI